MIQVVEHSNPSGRTTLRKDLFLKGSKPASFQTEQLILGTQKLTLVNRGNVPIIVVRLFFQMETFASVRTTMRMWNNKFSGFH